MHPILFELARPRLLGYETPLAVGSYGVLLLLGIGIAAWQAEREGRKLAPEVHWGSLVLVMAGAGLLGAKLFAALEHLSGLLAGRENPLALMSAGGSWLPGALAGALAGLAWLRAHRLPSGLAANVVATAAPLGHAVGRLGCLAAGCCHGSPTALAWGITYESPLAHQLTGVPLGVPLHPSPLYESLLELANFWLCLRLLRGGAGRFAVAAAWLGLYGAERFGLEFLRGDARSFLGPLSTSQWLCLAMVASSTLFFPWRAAADGGPGASPSSTSLQLAPALPAEQLKGV
ncbi:MAG: prolipoprotein diacylglyceryl transferase family protein [Thermoanaerobaculia bacterium]